ncbi:sugar porter family MFS transporter [Sphingomonas xinjiangensis]|uniref:SP family sugar:H+ symporter-like MFS transporter n=1 Tax=Sphingomonas xinjiangensis TaxID=643568 RepID=A0A840YM61_9SPHN|nr:sugar porter family MFS transporter [Sphingomonas xinjiangensis]MBB5710796.1 SP family sugar:H+ symporter-like MFS transporter [Sphingomonas xinjiangensis]
MDASAERANIGLIGAIVAVATIGGLLFGYDSGAVNGTQPGLTHAFALDSAGLGFTVGSLLIGCFIGAFFAGTLADRLGRRNVMRVSAVLFLIGALAQGLVADHTLFVIARIIGGMAVGAASVLSPAYISEVAPANIRGRMTTVQQIMIISGLTAAFFANYYLAAAAARPGVAGDVPSLNPLWLGIEAWRWMYLMQSIPAVIFLVALYFIPESPRYLVAKGRNEEALSVLTRLFGTTQGALKLAEIQGSFSKDHKPRLADVLAPTGGFLGIRSIVWAGLLLAVFQQLVGINVIFYYGATLWQAAGFTENDSLIINIISGSISIVACFVTVALVDKIGRKPLLLIGSAGMAVTLFIMVYAFSTGTIEGETLVLPGSMGKVAVAAALAYSALFNISWGPVMWVMLGEMFPNQLRGSALAVCGFAQWFANYLIAQSFPVMLAGLGLATSYSFYAICAAISFFLVQKFIHETKGKELEAMEG